MHIKFALSAGVASRALATAVVLSLGPLSAVADTDFPKQPVEITVLFGGPVATIAKLLGEGMSKELGVPVVAVSRTGGGGAVGYSYVHSTPPNGYNVVFNSNSVSTSYHMGNMPFD